MLTGLHLHNAFLTIADQRALLGELRETLRAAPFLRPTAPWGKPLSVRMTNAGRLGWVTDRSGYRYQETHPETGAPWPAIPPGALAVWRAVAETETPPDCCLINHYDASARLGLHRDDTEEDFRFPVVSISLGDAATFRIGGLARRDPTRSITLSSGDVFVMGGPARLVYHGVDRVKRRAPNLLDDAPEFGGGRLSLTLRRAGPAEG